MKPSSLLLPVLILLTFGLTSVADAQTVNSQDRDIGAVGAPGSASNNGTGGFTVTGSGADIWGTADEFHYVYFPLDGDMEIVARVTGVDFTDGWAKAGLMARESLNANSRNFMVFVTPQNLSGIQWRSTTGGNTDYLGGGSVATPQWIRLVRSGNTFSGYRSADGINWTPIGSAIIALPSTVYVGLAVTSHHDGTLCTADFDNVTHISGGGGGGTTGVPAAPTGLFARAVSADSIFLQWIDNSANETAFRIERSTDGINFVPWGSVGANAHAFSDNFLSPSTRYCYRVFASNSAGDSPPSNVDCDTTMASGGGAPGWQDQDIGTVSAAGSFSQSGNTFTVGGSGSDIWGTADELHYAYKYATGNVEVVARVTGMGNTSPWAKAGVMIRASVAPGAQHAILVLTPGNGLAFQWRASTDGQSFYTDAGAASAPVWVKLVKSGNTITGYRSADGVNWTAVGFVSISMPSAIVAAGLGVTSDNDGIVCLANFDNVNINTGGGSAPGVPTAPAGLTATAISASRIDLTWIDTSANETAFVVEWSTDGTRFTPRVTFNQNRTNFSDFGVSPGTHYWYRVIATNNAGASPPSNVADATTTSGSSGVWFDTDIGAVSAAGSFGQSGNTFTVRGSGYDIWDNNDEFHLAYQVQASGIQIVARILSVQNASPWAKAGVMIRSTFDANSPNVLLALTPSHGLAFQWRSSSGGQSSYIDGGAAAGPVWVKLVQTADTVTGYRSADGNNWTQVASVTIASGSPMLVGMAVTSHFDGTLCTGTFDNVTITSTGGGGGGGGTITIPAAPSGLTATATSSNNITLHWQDNASNENGFILERSTDGINFIAIGSFVADHETAVEAVNPGTHHWYRVAATNSAGMSPYSNVADATTPGGASGGGTLPSPWQSQNVGDVGVGGSASASQGTFTVKGSGADIWGTSDAFFFAYREINGNGELIARVTGLQNTEPWAKAGIMFRQVLDANRMNIGNAKNVFVMATPDHGTGLQWRSATSGGSSYIPGSYFTAPVWLRLVRQGDVFTGYSSLDGVNWTLIGSQTVSMYPVVVGLAVTSHNNSELNTATFDNVTWTPLP